MRNIEKNSYPFVDIARLLDSNHALKRVDKLARIKVSDKHNYTETAPFSWAASEFITFARN